MQEDYSDESYSLQYNQPGEVAFIITNEGGVPTYVISNEAALSTGEWHHIVAAWDAADVYLYIDGALVTDRRIYSGGWVSSLPPDFSPARCSDGGLMIGSDNNHRPKLAGMVRQKAMVSDEVKVSRILSISFIAA